MLAVLMAADPRLLPARPATDQVRRGELLRLRVRLGMPALPIIEHVCHHCGRRTRFDSLLQCATWYPVQGRDL